MIGNIKRIIKKKLQNMIGNITRIIKKKF
jgi:hypothetical protein